VCVRVRACKRQGGGLAGSARKRARVRESTREEVRQREGSWGQGGGGDEAQDTQRDRELTRERACEMWTLHTLKNRC